MLHARLPVQIFCSVRKAGGAVNNTVTVMEGTKIVAEKLANKRADKRDLSFGRLAVNAVCGPRSDGDGSIDRSTREQNETMLK